MKKYRGILLKESLKNESVLSKLNITQTKKKEEPDPTSDQPKVWTWYSIEVDQKDLEEVIKMLENSLKPKAWYTNLWCEGDYILIFPEKNFRANSTNDDVWQKAIEFGLSLEIPIYQLTPLDEILIVS